MQNIVSSCLKTCDSLKACSIAFPTLGTGGFNFPNDVATDIMVNAVGSYLKSNLTTTYIKTVKLMVYMEDIYSLHAKFYKFFTRIVDGITKTNISEGTRPLQGPLKTSHSSATNIEVKSFIVASLKAETMGGEFTEDEGEGIASRKVKSIGSGVASAILQEVGPEVHDIFDDSVSQGCEGRVCVTFVTCGLKCKHIIHTIAPKGQNWLLQEMIATCLSYAEKLQCTSISFPAVDTGSLGHDLEDNVAYNICSSIFLFGQDQPVHVKKVHNVCLEKAVCHLFNNKFLEVVSETGTGVERVVSGSQNILQTSSQPKAPSSVTLGSKNLPVSSSVNKVKTADQLQCNTNKHCTNFKLVDEFIPKLSCKDRDDIARVSKHRHVKISIETSNDPSYIQLKGDSDDVANAKHEIQQVLNHVRLVESTQRKAKLLYDKVKWQWLNSDSKYEDFEILTNYHIEQAYYNNRDVVFLHKEDGEFNFNKMEVFRYQSTYKIKRIDVQDLIKYGMLSLCQGHIQPSTITNEMIY